MTALDPARQQPQMSPEQMERIRQRQEQLAAQQPAAAQPQQPPPVLQPTHVPQAYTATSPDPQNVDSPARLCSKKGKLRVWNITVETRDSDGLQKRGLNKHQASLVSILMSGFLAPAIQAFKAKTGIEIKPENLNDLEITQTRDGSIYLHFRNQKFKAPNSLKNRDLTNKDRYQ